jgi:hypothetical protein
MLGGRPKVGSGQQRAELVTVQASDVRLIVQPRPPHVRSRRMLQQLFLDGVPVEPGDGAQAASDGGPGPPAGLQVPGEQLDVGAASLEQVQLVLPAPSRILAQVQLVRLPGQAAVPGQESS